MNQSRQHRLIIALAVLGWIGLSCHVQAAIKVFDNGGGDYLFSNASNWDLDTLPVNTDRVDVRTGTTAANPALVDPAWNVTAGNCYWQDASGTYVTVQSNATVKFVNLYLGSGSGKSGTLTVQKGGTIDKPTNTGTVFLGTLGNGHVIAEAGTTLGMPNLQAGSGSVFEYVADSADISSASLFGDTDWLMDGLLKVDLSDLAVEDTFILMSHDDDDSAAESMAGALRTWLDNGSGIQSGTGDGTFGSVFEVAGSAGKDWTLGYSETSGAGVLSLTVIPEPATLGMVAGAAAMLFGVRRLRLN